MVTVVRHSRVRRSQLWDWYSATIEILQRGLRKLRWKCNRDTCLRCTRSVVLHSYCTCQGLSYICIPVAGSSYAQLQTQCDRFANNKEQYDIPCLTTG
jgi:hypothetical protein